MSSLQLPEGIPGMAPGGPLPQALQGDTDDQGQSPLDCLKDVIDDFPRLLTMLQDPRDVQDAVKALQILAGVQTRLMTASNGPQAG